MARIRRSDAGSGYRQARPRLVRRAVSLSRSEGTRDGVRIRPSHRNRAWPPRGARAAVRPARAVPHRRPAARSRRSPARDGRVLRRSASESRADPVNRSSEAKYSRQAFDRAALGSMVPRLRTSSRRPRRSRKSAERGAGSRRPDRAERGSQVHPHRSFAARAACVAAVCSKGLTTAGRRELKLSDQNDLGNSGAGGPGY